MGQPPRRTSKCAAQRVRAEAAPGTGVEYLRRSAKVVPRRAASISGVKRWAGPFVAVVVFSFVVLIGDSFGVIGLGVFSMRVSSAEADRCAHARNGLFQPTYGRAYGVRTGCRRLGGDGDWRRRPTGRHERACDRHWLRPECS